jgi:hypothetical protein
MHRIHSNSYTQQFIHKDAYSKLTHGNSTIQSKLTPPVNSYNSNYTPTHKQLRVRVAEEPVDIGCMRVHEGACGCVRVREAECHSAALRPDRSMEKASVAQQNTDTRTQDRPTTIATRNR